MKVFGLIALSQIGFLGLLCDNPVLLAAEEPVTKARRVVVDLTDVNASEELKNEVHFKPDSEVGESSKKGSGSNQSELKILHEKQLQERSKFSKIIDEMEELKNNYAQILPSKLFDKVQNILENLKRIVDVFSVKFSSEILEDLTHGNHLRISEDLKNQVQNDIKIIEKTAAKETLMKFQDIMTKFMKDIFIEEFGGLLNKEISQDSKKLINNLENERKKEIVLKIIENIFVDFADFLDELRRINN